MLTQDPLFHETLRALDAFDEPLAVEGTVAARDLRLVLPTADRSPPLGPRLVPWLLERSEEAPFGDGERTRVDPEVRRAQRLIARGDVHVEGLDLRSILPRIEAVLSPDEHLSASLTDVLVYPAGGHFLRHRDTPRAGTMVGTLVICLPIPHRGGALHLTSGVRRATVLAEPPVEGGELSFAAFHGDVDHEVSPVREGHRVTLTYALHRDGRPRAGETAPREALRAAVSGLLGNKAFLPEGGKWLLPCARRALAPAKARQLSVEDLVGRDREIAGVLTALGLGVRVRRCLAVVPAEGKESAMTEPLRSAMVAIRLASPLPAKMGEVVTLARHAHDDEEDEVEADSLHSFEARDAPRSACLVRAAAYATLVHEAAFSESGYFGNEHFDAWFYAFAAIEVDVPDQKARGLVAAPVLPRVRHKKFGEGVILSETPGDGDVILEIKFDDGTVRKLLSKFVQR